MPAADLIERVRKHLRRRKGFEEKKMFGGTGFLLNGNMCCGIHKRRLILRLGIEAAEAALQQPHVKPFDITGKPMRGWAMIDERHLDDEGTLREWVLLAVGFAKTLPEK